MLPRKVLMNNLNFCVSGNQKWEHACQPSREYQSCNNCFIIHLITEIQFDLDFHHDACI